MTRRFATVGLRIWLIALALTTGPLAREAFAVTVPGNYPTVQAAINAVLNGSLPDGTTIDVQAGVFNEALVVSNTGKSFTVRGAGASATFIDAIGKGAPALTMYQATGQIIFSRLTFRRGAPAVAAGGGFVITRSSPSFVDCVFEQNAASAGGGGALMTSNASFTRCIIRNNSAARSGGGVLILDGSRPVFLATDIVNNSSGTGGNGVGNAGVGGGVDARDSFPTFRGSRVSGNASKFAAGGIYHGGEFGSPYGIARLVVEDSEVADNLSSPHSAADNPAEGGGIHIEDNAQATLTRVRVLRNRANSGGGLNAYRARYDIVDSIIDANQAISRGDGGLQGGFGGGIHATSTNVGTPARPASIVNLTGTLLRNSTAITGGGIVVTGDVNLPATLTLVNSVLDSNQTQNQGGGVLLSRANLTSTNSMIIRNSALAGSVPFGGGILISTSSSATLRQTTIARNTAGVYGGGIFMDGNSSIDIAGSQIYDNTVTAPPSGQGGGALFVGPNGNQTGQVATSTIADNNGYQIVEHPCPKTRLTYNSNTITPKVGANDVYVSGCPGSAEAVTSITRFEALSNTSGNNSNLPRFAHFLAVPASGTSATLAWSVARATSVTIAGVGTFNNQPTGSVDVTPGGSATYSLTATADAANGGNYGAVTAGVVVVYPPTAPSSSVLGDFDGNGLAEVAVFRPSTGVWYIQSASAAVTWGGNGDVPLPGDFDGDGKADVAVFRPITGTWYVINSSTQAGSGTTWGGGGDRPVPADYDGDGKTDLAVFRPATGVWYIWQSSSQTGITYTWGGGSDVPVPGDYDGDGKADIAVFRPLTGVWYIWRSASQTGITYTWGGGTDVAVPADYDGDGKIDIGVFRPQTGLWYIWRSASQTGITYTWGGGGDQAVPADYDGDGKSDIAVFRPSTGVWYIWRSASQTGITYTWGGGTDLAVVRKYCSRAAGYLVSG